ncbi:Uncharacterized protein conserved in bacteria [Serratia rubidaea]|uniref:Uncharacterized protein conserved in bacteria n=1 Tax=Serratia rubidaea TaxID=61652 RepID=A0A447QU04_SERRU|nr:Uncharacterized protein conserved in bacteria [Serratia rubidaea]
MTSPRLREQPRQPHNSQWYHETQRSVRGDLPLEPQAALIRDRFLLGLGEFTDPALNQALIARAPVFGASLACCHVLFPEQVALSRHVTLSPYDRLCTALTVAQVTGVQSLCSHYAARLAPLDSPDASRESNIRLAQITQYARQLATQPTLICRKALQQLSDVGLSVADIVSFVQIHRLCQLSGAGGRRHRRAGGRPRRWRRASPPSRTPSRCASTNAANLAGTLARCSPPRRRPNSWTCWTRATRTRVRRITTCCWPRCRRLRERNGVFNGIHGGNNDEENGRLMALAALCASRINGSRYCAAGVAADLQHPPLVHALCDSIDDGYQRATPRQQAVIQVSSALTRSPEKFTRTAYSRCFSRM